MTEIKTDHFETDFSGRTLFSRYLVESIIGKGASGEVYLAKDLQLDRFVAIKVIATNQSDDRLKRFLRESQILATLDHPGIVKILAVNKIDDRHPCILMEFLEGKTLDSHILKNVGMKADDCKEISEQIILALVYLHSKGIIHRDLKPSNIMVLDSLDSIKITKLLDFGLAKDIVKLDSNETIAKNIQVGTANYMSPEICKGEKADHRSDLYSLACIIYECVSGNTLFQADTDIEIMSKQISETVVLHQFSKNLANFLQKALEKDPLNRFQSIEEMQVAFEKLSLADFTKIIKTEKQKKNYSANLLFLIIVLVFVIVIASSVVYLKSNVNLAQINKISNRSKSSRTSKILLHEAEVAAMNGKDNEAIQKYFQVLELEKDQHTKEKFQALLSLALIKCKFLDYDAGLKYILELKQEIEKSTKKNKDWLIKQKYQLAEIYFQQKKFSDSISLDEENLKLIENQKSLNAASKKYIILLVSRISSSYLCLQNQIMAEKFANLALNYAQKFSQDIKCDLEFDQARLAYFKCLANRGSDGNIENELNKLEQTMDLSNNENLQNGYSYFLIRMSQEFVKRKLFKDTSSILLRAKKWLSSMDEENRSNKLYVSALLEMGFANLAHVEKNDSETKEHFLSALKILEPIAEARFAGLYIQLGNHFFVLKQYSEAEKAYNYAAKIFDLPKFANEVLRYEPYFGLVKVYCRMRNLSKAKELISMLEKQLNSRISMDIHFNSKLLLAKSQLEQAELLSTKDQK